MKATTPAQQKWTGRWEQLKGKAQKLWGKLTDDDFTRAQGDYDQIVGLINERTGETRERIEELLNK